MIRDALASVRRRLAPQMPIAATRGRTVSLARVAAGILGEYSTTVLDIGARGGADTAWWRLNPLAQLVGFEPDPTECARLNEAAIQNGNGVKASSRFFPLALGAKSETRPFYETADPQCSSLFPPNEAVSCRYPRLRVHKLISTRQLETVALDDWWRREGRPNISFIKLDTQGAELDILRGGQEVVRSCLGIEVEVQFVPLYVGVPLFHEVSAYLGAQAFQLWRLQELSHCAEAAAGGVTRADQILFDSATEVFGIHSGRLMWANAVFLRDYADIPVDDWKRLLVLGALLQGLGDNDGAAAALTRTIGAPSLTDEMRAQLLPAAGGIREVRS